VLVLCRGAIKNFKQLHVPSMVFVQTPDSSLPNV
jgi:hypothetical protein